MVRFFNSAVIVFLFNSFKVQLCTEHFLILKRILISIILVQRSLIVRLFLILKILFSALKGVVFLSEKFETGDVELMPISRVESIFEENVLKVVKTVKVLLPFLRESYGEF